MQTIGGNSFGPIKFNEIDYSARHAPNLYKNIDKSWHTGIKPDSQTTFLIFSLRRRASIYHNKVPFLYSSTIKSSRKMKSYQLIFSLFLFSTAVWAQGAHFQKKSPTISILDNGALSVVWDEAGLGNGGPDGKVHYSLQADGNAVYQCFNNGGHHPQAGNKETVQNPVATGTSETPDHGRVQGSLISNPPSPGGFSCPAGQVPVLRSVSYSGSFCDITFNDCATISVSRNF